MRWGTSTRIVAVLAICGMVLAAPGAAHATPFDSFDESTFNDLEPGGREIKYTSGVQVVKTVVFSSAAFGVQAGERGGPTDMTGCALGPGSFSFGGRTAWVRFVSGVAGSLKVDATTAFDVILWERAGPLRQPGSTSFAELGAADCIDTTDPTRSAGEHLGPDRVQPDSVVHVELASWCGTGVDVTTACPDPAAPAGGGVTLKLTFTPDDQDGDGVADTLDQCPAVKGSALDGCPDADGDGVSDYQDQCPGVKGNDAVGCLKQDADRDGYRTDVAPVDCNDGDAAIFPGAFEIVNNAKDDDCDGNSSTDADGDGYPAAPAGKDCNDADPAISPIAVEVRGNTIDEDCKDGAAPYQRVGRDVVLDFFYGHNVKARRSGFVAPRVIKRPRGPLPTGLIVDVRCRGRGCPFGSRTYRPRLGASFVSLRGLDKALLGDGTRVEVRMIVPGRIGRVLSYTMRSRPSTPPKATELCLMPGADRPVKC